MSGDNVGFLCCYFNDNGVNPMHDEFFAPMGPEAPAIREVARGKATDVTVFLHNHGSPSSFHRPKYVPLDLQSDSRPILRPFNTLSRRTTSPLESPRGFRGEWRSISRVQSLERGVPRER